jgi:hypothetical protein
MRDQLIEALAVENMADAGQQVLRGSVGAALTALDAAGNWIPEWPMSHKKTNCIWCQCPRRCERRSTSPASWSSCVKCVALGEVPG